MRTTKVIFLDVDGVLNYIGSKEMLPQGTYFVADEKIKILKDMVQLTGAELVLSSSWRSGWSTTTMPKRQFSMEESKPYFMLCAKLHDYGLSLLSEIPRLNNASREDAIAAWITNWPGQRIEDYVILDDEARKFSKKMSI